MIDNFGLDKLLLMEKQLNCKTNSKDGKEGKEGKDDGSFATAVFNLNLIV